MYCEDCKAEVEIRTIWTWIGDPGVTNGVQDIQVWECSVCGGENLREKDIETMIGRYCIVRTFSAGVFAGILASREGKEAIVTGARRLWYWKGASSLSQLAMEGTKSPSSCKFAMPVAEVLLTEVIEIIPATDDALQSIQEVPDWKM